jgi:membrane protein DedA with SNARE-associated domain
VGDGIMFAAGRLYGERVLRFRPVAKIMTPERFAATQEKFARYGNWVLFVARFLPGLRSPIFLTAGMTRRIPYWRFLMMDGFAALISVPVWVYLGYFGARNREWLMHMVHRGQAGILIALAVAGLVLGVYFWRKKRKAANAGA